MNLDDREDAPAPVLTRRGRAAARVRGLTIDLSPLRASRQFRLLWIGEVVSHAGRHITVVALPYQVYELTGSALAVGMIGLVQIVPVMVFSMVGGAIADAVDRRKLMLVMQAGLIAASLLLVAGALVETPPLWFLYVAAALISACSSIESPARTAAIPNLVSRKHLPAAMALNQIVFQVSDIAGPAVGGLIIARFGLVWAYAADAASFLGAVVTLVMMRPLPPQGEPTGARGIAAVREGFAFLRGRPVITSTFVIDLNAMIFGMPRALFPVLADRAFGVGVTGLGLLYAAPATGALLAALASGWVGGVRRQGRAVLWAVAVWGLAITAFGVTARPSLFWLGLVFLAIAGAADVISAVFRATILQASVPDRLRGRLSAIHLMVVTGGPRLGDFEAGAVAHLVSPVFSVVSGGLASMAGVVALALLVPAFARYRAPEDAAEP